jgi:hypothetical protein
MRGKESMSNLDVAHRVLGREPSRPEPLRAENQRSGKRKGKPELSPEDEELLERLGKRLAERDPK